MKLSQLVTELQQTYSIIQAIIEKDVDIYTVSLSENSRLDDGIIQIDYLNDFSALHLKTNNTLFTNRIELSPQINIYELFETISDILNTDYQIMQDKQTLLDKATNLKDIDSILEVAHSMLKNPIIVVDNSYKIIAMTKDFESYRPDLKEQKELGYVLTENIKLFYEHRQDQSVMDRKTSKIRTIQNINSIWLFCEISIDNTEIAHIASANSNHPFTRYDYELFEFLSSIISLKFSQNNYFNYEKNVLHSFFVTELLEEEIKDTTVLNYRIQQIEWSTQQYFQVATISENEDTFSDSKIKIILNNIIKIFELSIWTVYNNQIVVLISLEEPLSTWQPSETVSYYLKDNNLKITISDYYTNLLETKKYYLQTIFVNDFVSKAKKKEILYFYENYKFEAFLSKLKKTQNLSSFYSRSINEMFKYDQKNQTNYLLTLKEYLKYNNNPTLISQNLFIHKNTLFFRINKIKELFNLDLNDGDVRFNCQFTIKMMEFEQLITSDS